MKCKYRQNRIPERFGVYMHALWPCMQWCNVGASYERMVRSGLVPWEISSLVGVVQICSYQYRNRKCYADQRVGDDELRWNVQTAVW